MRARYVVLLIAAAAVLFVGLSRLPLWPRGQRAPVRLRIDGVEDGTDGPVEAEVADALPVVERAVEDEDALADILFRRLDRNGDGRLAVDELPPALRTTLPEWDADGDGQIDAAEFRQYFRARLRTIERQTPPMRSLLSRGGLPAAPADRLPTWFADLDTDRDGQVSLAEWRAAGFPVEEFVRLDRDGDGFLTAREVRTYQGEAALDASDPTAGDTPRGDQSDPANARANPPAGRTTPASIEAGFFAGITRKKAASRTRSASTQRARPALARASSRPPAAAPPAPSLLDSNAYWATRNAQITAEAAAGHTNVVFLGDSITDNLENGSGGPVWDLFFAPLGAEDFAVAGYTTAEVLAQVQAGDVSAVSPRVIVLLIGTNDLALGSSPAEVTAAIGGIVTTLTKQLPQTRILLLGILPRGADPFEPMRPLVAETNVGLARLADGSRVRFLDIGADFLMPDGTISPYVMADYLHPTLFGYQIYTSVVLGPIQGLLDAGPLPKK
jgi:beta-glucosidase